MYSDNSNDELIRQKQPKFPFYPGVTAKIKLEETEFN